MKKIKEFIKELGFVEIVIIIFMIIMCIVMANVLDSTESELEGISNELEKEQTFSSESVNQYETIKQYTESKGYMFEEIQNSDGNKKYSATNIENNYKINFTIYENSSDAVTHYLEYKFKYDGMLKSFSDARHNQTNTEYQLALDDIYFFAKTTGNMLINSQTKAIYENEVNEFINGLINDSNLVVNVNENESNSSKMGLFEIRKSDHDSYYLGVGYLILIPVVIIAIIILKRYSKYKKEIQAGEIPQEYLNKFENLYNKLYKQNSKELKKLRQLKNMKRIALYVVIALTIFCLFKLPRMLIFIFFGVIIYLITTSARKKVFGNKQIDSLVANFKENIVDPIIKLAIPDAIYTPKDGISESKYDEVDWDYYDSFESEDLIEGKIKLDEINDFETDITMSEVYTTYETKDSDGDTHTHVSFSGLVAYITLPETVGCEIHVMRGKSRASNLKADMTEFEKLYDIETDDKIKAMEIFTADIMSDIVDLTKRCKVDFRFDIQKDKLYFKFYTGKMFEPQIFNKKMEKIMLQKYYNIVRMCVKISKEICEILLKANI